MVGIGNEVKWISVSFSLPRVYGSTQTSCPHTPATASATRSELYRHNSQKAVRHMGRQNRCHNRTDWNNPPPRNRFQSK